MRWEGEQEGRDMMGKRAGKERIRWDGIESRKG